MPRPQPKCGAKREVFPLADFLPQRKKVPAMLMTMLKTAYKLMYIESETAKGRLGG